jgi:hypothetical protein
VAEKPKRKKWIAKATEGAHGQFRAKAEKAGESTREYAEHEKGAAGKTGKQARLALALMGAAGARRKRYNHPSSHKD